MDIPTLQSRENEGITFNVNGQDGNGVLVHHVSSGTWHIIYPEIEEDTGRIKTKKVLSLSDEMLSAIKDIAGNLVVVFPPPEE